MFKRAFGCLGFLLGVFFGGFLVYGFFKIPEMHNMQSLESLVFSGLLIAFGVTWMRGGTFGRR